MLETKSKAKRSEKKSPKVEKKAIAKVAVDFPQANETIQAGHYAVRLSAQPDVAVEISIDGSEWALCRFGVGHFWFDWYPSKTGRVTLQARAKAGDSDWSSPESRTVQVKK